MIEVERPVKALTLWRPWPSIIVWGPKRIENRPIRWRIPTGGILLALHAGKKYDDTGAQVIREIWQGAGEILHNDDAQRLGIVGACVVRQGAVAKEDLPNNPWAFGPWCYVLHDVVGFETPIEMRGQQGLWPLDPETEDMVRELHRTGPKDPAPPTRIVPADSLF